MNEFKIENLFDLSHTIAEDYLKKFIYPWEALAGIGEFIREVGPKLNSEEYDHPSEGVWIAKSARVFPSAYIGAPCIIGPDTEVRHCAFIRGSALIGAGAVIGNSVEVKNAIIFDGAQVPHFNYVGDSIIGYKAHMGAGAITSNVKGDKSLVVMKNGDQKIETGMKKVGAMLGDRAEIGCNCVLNPGAVVGRDARVYPLSCVRGYVPAGSLYKSQNEVVNIER